MMLRMPGGIIHEIASPRGYLIAVRDEGEGSNDRTLEFWNDYSVITMARIDKSKRGYLSSNYMRALMSFALFRPLPDRVLNIGLGAGLLTMAVHAMLPGVIVDSVEWDHLVLDVAADYFGFNRHLGDVMIGDGAQILESRDDETYEAILMDAYGLGASPPAHLWTREFWWLCKEKMIDGGIVATNVLEDSQDIQEIHDNMAAVFKVVYQTTVPGNIVFYGTDVRIPRAKLRRRAAMFDKKTNNLHRFSELSEDNLRKDAR